MSGYVKAAVLSTLILLGGAARSDAASITWNLGCTISSGACAASPTWGTLKLEDVAPGDVKVTLTLANTNARIQSFYLNYDLAIAWSGNPNNNTNDLQFIGLSPSVLVDANDISADGYGSPFDVQIPATGNLGNISSFVGTLQRTGGLAITIANFQFTTGPANLFAAVHIGNINAQGDSIWVGTTGASDSDGGSDSQVPEPATMALVGLGLALAGSRLRKRTR